MAYQPNIPLATDQISKSQLDIQGNFQALAPLINGIFDMPVQIAFPAPTGDNILYAKNYATTAKNEVFIQNAAGVNIPITAASLGAQGFTELPSGLLIKWGVASIPLIGNNPIGLNVVGQPNFTTAFWALFSFAGTSPANASAKIDSITPATLTINCVNANIDVYWVVFGTGV